MNLVNSSIGSPKESHAAIDIHRTDTADSIVQYLDMPRIDSLEKLTNHSYNLGNNESTAQENLNFKNIRLKE